MDHRKAWGNSVISSKLGKPGFMAPSGLKIFNIERGYFCV